MVYLPFSYSMPNHIYTYILNIYYLQINSLLVTLYLNETEFICLHTVKLFHRFVLNFNTSNQNFSFVYTSYIAKRT